MVYFGDTYASVMMYSPDHVATNEKDFWYEDPKIPSFTNYWLANDHNSGSDAHLNMFFACQVEIQGFYIKNTHGAAHNDRGTDAFKIFSSDSSNGPWTEIVSGNLPDARNVENVPTLDFALETPITTQYIKFQIESYFDWGGGLQYFAAY